MDKVSVFESSDFGELRIIVDPKGDVWFVASDVAKSLGYINAKDAVKRHVDDDDSMLLQVSDNQWGVKRSILKTRYIDSIRIINESGLYSLILSSKLESAKRFKKWVTSEVLPSIRKTGEYKTSSGGKGILVPDFSNPADAKIGSLYEMVTKNVIVSTTNTVFGINPRAWIALPCEGLILLKIRQVVPTAGSALPVQIAVPANSTVSTVGADTCCPVTGVNVVNPINVAVTGAAMVNGTERLLYFNKVRGVLRLMDCCVPTTTAQASEVKAGK